MIYTVIEYKLHREIFTEMQLKDEVTAFAISCNIKMLTMHVPEKEEMLDTKKVNLFCLQKNFKCFLIYLFG